MATLSQKPVPNRPKRVPLHQQGRLDVTNTPGYVPRWVNDYPGRVDAMLKAGYRFVPKENDDSVRNVEDASSLGSYTSKVVNKGIDAAAKVGYLMEIQKELYDEDQLDKLKVVDRSEEAMNPKAQGADYGMFRKEYQ